MNNISTEDFIRWLGGFINFERNLQKGVFNLEKMKTFAAFFGNPQRIYKSLHVAGSKGKGSVSIMLASILKEAGFLIGLFTSPHVMDFRERMTLAGTFFSDSAYSNTYKKIIKGFKEIIEKNPAADPGWFEIVTMTAFLLFKEEKTDITVFETGMGGRLDMTNILLPEACILTPIELEHCKYLGDTIAKIAFEKAGIIKQRTPVFCSKQDDEALAVFRKKASKMNAPFFYLPEILKRNIECRVSAENLAVKIEWSADNSVGKLFARPLQTRLCLLDEIQSENAALAACTAKYLFPALKEDVIERGLSKAWLPARFEILSKNPLIVIDGAHTKNSIALCVNTYFKFGCRDGVLVFACADDKDTKDIAPLFKKGFKKILITRPGVFKKSDPDKTYADFKAAFQNSQVHTTVIEKNENYKYIIKMAITECKNTGMPLLVTGSFYLAAEAKTIFLNGN